MKLTTCHCCNGKGTEIDQTELAKSLRDLRESKSLLMKTVAERMSLSLSYLSDLERGKRNWNDELVERFKQACAQS